MIDPGRGIARRVAAVIAVAAVGLSAALVHPAQAIPSFSRQTGQDCTACHVGAFGPQLTPYGRAFKIAGYTQAGGSDFGSQIPLSAMFAGSFTRTSRNQPEPPERGFARNNNFALDEVQLYLAGRVTDWAGGMIRANYSGVERSTSLEMVDLRLTNPFDAGDTELRLGVSFNNFPTVQDPYNTTFAWSFPYMRSDLAPRPAAQPLLGGALGSNALLGATAYGWWDKSLYVELGGYGAHSANWLRRLGHDMGLGGTVDGLAPYGRLAYEWLWNGQAVHVGALGMYATVIPDGTGGIGRDRHTNLGIDASYQFLGDGRHVVSVYGIYLHEWQDLAASFEAGAASQPRNRLDNLRVNVSYYFDNTYGLTFGVLNTWGNANPARFAPTPVVGSANGKPNSTAFILQADWTPFGKADSWGAPWANLRLGVQFVGYTRFNGASSNYDGFGRNARDNNTIYTFLLLTF